MKKYPFTIEYDPTLDKGIKSFFEIGYDVNREFFKIDLRKFRIKIWYDRVGFNRNFKLPKNTKYSANSGMKPGEPMDVMSPHILQKEKPNFSIVFLKRS